MVIAMRNTSIWMKTRLVSKDSRLSIRKRSPGKGGGAEGGAQGGGFEK